MKKILLAFIALGATSLSHAELKITGVYDGPLPGGLPKGVELYVSTDIADLSAYGVGFANNGGGSDGVEFTFPSIAVAQGEYIYIATESTEFENFFGGSPDYTTGNAAINGDDAIELFFNAEVTDRFGDINVDGSGQPWEYLDGWAKRDPSFAVNPDFNIDEWQFSGANAFDGFLTNADAVNPFPLGEIPPSSGEIEEPVIADISLSELHYDNDGSDQEEGFEISGPVGTDLTGWTVVLYNGNSGAPYNTINLSGSLVDAEACNEGYAHFPVSGIQNGSPDGLALVDPSNNVVEFLSYEGEMVASSGPAAGMSSVDIGVAESASTAIGSSLQKIDGVWNEPAPNTFGSCGSAPAQLVRIHEIQGAGDSVAISSVSTVSAIVTASYQAENQLRGFFIQEEDADVDQNSATPEGIFVYCDACPVSVSAGDLVEVTGLPSDFNSMSQIRATQESDIRVLSSGNNLPSASPVELPIVGDRDMYYEALEGMRIRFTNTLTVSEYFQLGRFGEVVLAAGGRPRQFTDQFAPDENGYSAFQEQLAARTIVLDDVFDGSNTALFDNLAVYYPQPGLSVDNFFRGGDTIETLEGVLQFSFSKWRVRPINEVVFTQTNPRPEAPADVVGNLKVASFNVLNYFTTINETGTGCGADGSLECRGAHSVDELLRQTQKIVAAICTIDADIVGLMEIENVGPNTEVPAISTLVSEINAVCPEYAALETGTLGGDAISVGFIYKPQQVELIGETAILDSDDFIDPNNTGSPKNRPAIAQSFKAINTGSSLTIAVNHLKSKGSSCGAGDDSPETGQANCNVTRTLAAQRQADWLASNPTGVDSENILIIGDLNAYRREDPITALKDAGYIDLVDHFGGDDAYGFVFDGQVGYLDHALANAELFPYITGVSEWHINADEINLFDYNDEVRDDEERSFEAKPSATELFAPNAYRSSDHDPVIIGIEFPQSANPRALVELFLQELEAGSIVGYGRIKLLSYINLKVFAWHLYRADHAFTRGRMESACAHLRMANLYSDGNRRDRIVGEGVAELNANIRRVQAELSCTNK